MEPYIAVQQADFDIGAELDQLAAAGGAGALATFTGLVRADGAVQALELEHYPGMTERSIRAVVDEAARRWPLVGARVIHRVGHLPVGSRIVLVAVASPHRGEAFAACEFIMDYLKTRAPFWKKAHTADGSHWIEARQRDQEAAARWQ